MKHRTFHHHRHELHGITVVVDTHGAQIWVGRCDDIDDDGVILLDADVHEDGHEGRSKQDWVREAARYGVWKRLDRVVLGRDAVVSVTRLADIAVE
jgi:hypothetical protein